MPRIIKSRRGPAPGGVGLSKRLLNASSSVTLEQALEDEARCQHITYTSEDLREGITAFLERREPRFRGC